jgi:hypothetical protein
MSRSPESDTTRVTITLPTPLVRELDERLGNGDTNRGTAIRRLIEAALQDLERRESRKREADEEREQYVRAWREQPQTEEEFGWSNRVVSEAMAEEPWKRSMRSDRGAVTSGGPISAILGGGVRSCCLRGTMPILS